VPILVRCSVVLRINRNPSSHARTDGRLRHPDAALPRCGRRARGAEPPHAALPARAPHRAYPRANPSLLSLTARQPGTIVVNAGDLLARWSNDTLRSTLHRVVAPPAKPLSDADDERVGLTPRRQSIAFFCNPNQGAKIECLPNCWSEAVARKYEPVTTEEYIVRRLSETYM
jgi:hypothetical protein